MFSAAALLPNGCADCDGEASRLGIICVIFNLRTFLIRLRFKQLAHTKRRRETAKREAANAPVRIFGSFLTQWRSRRPQSGGDFSLWGSVVAEIQLGTG